MQPCLDVHNMCYKVVVCPVRIFDKIGLPGEMIDVPYFRKTLNMMTGKVVRR